MSQDEIKPLKKNIKEAVNSAINKNKIGFDLAKFKETKNLTTDGMKPQTWIKVSDAFTSATGLPGIPEGQVTIIRGHSDTGKSALGIEAVVSAQKAGKLPVLIITEMKFSWEHARIMGLDFEEVPDPNTGEVRYEGHFIYADIDKVGTIEQVAAFMADLMDEQAKGKLPFDLVFFWDCAGTIPCQQSIDSKSQNNEWAAAAMSRNFGNYIDQKIITSRKINRQFINTFIVVNKIWVDKPATYGALPTVKSKGGNALYSDAALVILFGNVTNSGTSKIKAQKNGKEIEFAKRTRVSIEKNHIDGVTASAKIIITPHGFILDEKKYIDRYKKEHANEWLSILGVTDFDLVEEEDKQENINDIQGED
jgi:RecA/RadA recombinase